MSETKKTRFDQPRQDSPAEITNPNSREAVSSELEVQPAVQARKAWWTKIKFGKICLFILSLYLFILAIVLMKDSAQALSPLIRDFFNVTTVAKGLGFGWLFAYIVMSGSPVAAATLAFLDGGVVDRLSAYAMITGSRLGASFIVLLIGFLYVLRGRNQANSLGMGLLSLIITATTYLPGFLVGLVILENGWLEFIQPQQGALLTSITNLLTGSISEFIVGFFPRWAVFLIGIGIIYLSFQLFDLCLPQMAIKESQVGQPSRLIYRPIVMFMLGSLVTLISMSVSISLGILVPLSNRGFVRRENVIPYILGANITTFIDTLFAALLLGNTQAFTIVFVQMVSISLISFFILLFLYAPYQQLVLTWADWVTSDNLHLTIFTATIILLPILLLVI